LSLFPKFGGLQNIIWSLNFSLKNYLFSISIFQFYFCKKFYLIKVRWIKTRKTAINLITAYYFQLALLLGVGIYGISAVNKLVRQFDDLFGKKLIPAMDISHVLELQYQNRFHLEEFLTGLSLENQVQLLDDIHRNNAEMDSIVNLYITAASFMEAEERQDLKDFAKAQKTYKKEENYIINLHGSGHGSVAASRFKVESNIKFQEAVKPMKKFEAIELVLGKKIFDRVKGQVNVINWVLYIAMSFGILLAITIGINLGRQFMEN